MIKIVELFGKRKIKKRSMYAITDGQYVGQFVIFTTDGPVDGHYPIVFLPEIKQDNLAEDVINEGLKLGILDYVKRLPSAIYHETIRQVHHKQRIMQNDMKEALNEYNNRRQQFTTPDILGEQEQSFGDDDK